VGWFKTLENSISYNTIDLAKKREKNALLEKPLHSLFAAT